MSGPEGEAAGRGEEHPAAEQPPLLPTPAVPEPNPYVSRGGLKMHAALAAFAPLGMDARGLTCADFGCSTGGFTDCLLQHGAARVYAIDTAYGELAWRLRNDPRVTVMERTNCLHAPPPVEVAGAGGVDLVVADAGWTVQRLLVPAALRWLTPAGRMITLVKPHYEKSAAERDAGGRSAAGRSQGPRGGRGAVVLDEREALEVTRRVLAALPALGVRVEAWVRSPVLGGADARGKGGGNPEYLALLARA